MQPLVSNYATAAGTGCWRWLQGRQQHCGSVLRGCAWKVGYSAGNERGVEQQPYDGSPDLTSISPVTQNTQKKKWKGTQIQKLCLHFFGVMNQLTAITLRIASATTGASKVTRLHGYQHTSAHL